MRKIFAGLALALALGGCVSITPATYTVSPEIRQSLAQYYGQHASVVAMTAPASFDPMCRAVGNVRIENDLSVAQFVQKAFNDELRYAGIAGEGGVQLTGTLNKVDFSSSASVVNGYWDLDLTLTSSNGKSMQVPVHYDFSAGFSGITACSNTSQALARAAQALVRKTVADPRFSTLLK